MIEQAPALVGGLSVDLLEVVEETEGAFEQRSPGAELVIDFFELSRQPGPLFGDAVQALADLGLRRLAVSRQIEQVLLLDVEPGELSFELVMQQLGRLTLISQCRTERLTNLILEGDF